jgi:hypothetical protein
MLNATYHDPLAKTIEVDCPLKTRKKFSLRDIYSFPRDNAAGVAGRMPA